MDETQGENEGSSRGQWMKLGFITDVCQRGAMIL